MEDKILEILERLETKIDNLESKVDENTKDIKGLKAQISENTQILKALEHSAEVNKAEHDKMSNDIAKIQGDVTRIRKDLSFVEQATAKNWADVAELKIVK